MAEREATTPPAAGALESLMGELAEEFTARLRAGENVSIGDYTARHPNLAPELRQILGAICVLERGRPATESTPTQLGDYRILRELGRGGMGVVYEAVQTSLDRRVALKVLPASSFADESRRERFHREAHAAARLHHTNIVPVFAVGEQGDTLYYAMQLIEGHGLDATVKEWKRSLDPDRQRAHKAARLIVQAAEALEHAHRQGILHRDVKPSNLLLDANGTVWLSDFGLVHAEGAESLTATGQVLGTMRYLPPEGFQGRADARSDVYSLGLTLYELLAGRPAFDETDHLKLMKQASESEPPRLRTLCRGLPRDLETVVLKAINRDPARRYQSAGDFAEDLRRFQQGEPVQARRLGLVKRCGRWVNRHRALTVAALLVALVLAAGTGLVVRTLDSQELEHALNQAIEARQAAEEERSNAEAARAETQQALERERRVVYANRIRLADSHRSQGRLADGLQALQQCPEDLRGWEWRYLHEQCAGKSLRYDTHQVYPQSRVNGNVAALSPDGTLLAYPTPDNAVAVCDAVTGTQKLRLGTPQGQVIVLGFHPEGRHLTTVSISDKVLRERRTFAWVAVWDLGSGKQTALFGVPWVRALSPDGQLLAWVDSRTDDAVLTVTNVSTRRIVATVPLPAYRAIKNDDLSTQMLGNHVWFSLDNREVMLFTNYRTSLTHVVLNQSAKTIPRSGTFRQFAFPREQKKVFALQSTNVELRDRATLETAWSKRLPFTLGLGCSDDGRRVGVGLTNNEVRLLDGQTGEQLAGFQGHPGAVFFVGFSPDGKRLLSACRGGMVMVWETEQRPPFLSLPDGLAAASHLAFHPDGTRLAVGSGNKVQIWDWRRGKMLAGWSEDAVVNDMAFQPGGRLLAIAARRESLSLRYIDSGKEQPHKDSTPRAIERLAFCPAGKRLFATDMRSRSLLLWDLEHAPTPFPVRTTGLVASAAISGDFNILALDTGHEISVLNANTCERLYGLPRSRDKSPNLLLSADGNLLALQSQEGVLEIWDTKVRRRLHQLHGHGFTLKKLAFSPDGRCLAATIAQGKRIVVWDVATGLELLDFPVRATVTDLAFSPDGACLAATTQGGTLLWDAGSSGFAPPR